MTVAQVALYLFNLLKKDYIDGLICNETTNALWEFYTKYNPYRSRDVSELATLLFGLKLTGICTVSTERTLDGTAFADCTYY